MAVGLNRWWNSSLDVTVATIITTLYHYNNTVISITNNTVFPNKTESFNGYGFYDPYHVSENPSLNTIDALNSILQGVTFLGDYAGSSPTPYDEYFRFGILTATPISNPAITRQLQFYPVSQCGTSWSGALYPYGWSDENIVDFPIWTYERTHGNSSFFNASELLLKPEDYYENNIGAAVINLGATGKPGRYDYISVRSSARRDGNYDLILPTGMISWLADIPASGTTTAQDETQSTTPDRQPAITVTAEQPSEQSAQSAKNSGGGARSAQTTSTDRGELPYAISSTAHQDQSTEAAASYSIGEQSTVVSYRALIAQTASSSAQEIAPTTPSAAGDGPITAYAIGTETASPGGSAIVSSGTTYSALTFGPEASGNDNGYAVDSQGLSASGTVVSEGTTYYAPSSGPGVVVAVSGASSTVLQGIGPSITALAASGQYKVGGQTVAAGGDAVAISGTTYSALPSGSGVLQIQSGVTSTIEIGAGASNLVTMSGGVVISAVVLSPNSASSITVGTEVLQYQPLGSNVAVIGQDTLTVGGAAVTANSEIYSLATDGSGLALVVNGTSTAALPTAAAGEGIVTIGGQVYTAYADGSSRVIVDGQTVYPGATTMINSETVRLSGTDLVAVSGSVTSTEGLGGAIMSGLNGPGGPSSISAAVAYTGASQHRRPAAWMIGLATGMVAIMMIS
ncbi:hypothetical protein LTR85_002646 [Meristemomyces frigidus]|nr:hypothetical protein LTR85_002646 [Meristemomyces frigidus]